VSPGRLNHTAINRRQRHNVGLCLFCCPKAKVLVLHGADDGFISADAITAFQEGMRKAGADWQMVYFGGTVHSFTNPGADKVGIKGIAYHPKADKRSWNYMQVFFKEIFK